MSKQSESTSEVEDEKGPDTEPHPRAAETVPLPPLSSVLPAGEEGAHAFKRLMQALLGACAAQHEFRYDPAEPPGLVGAGGAAPDGGVPGLDGPAVFLLLWGEEQPTTAIDRLRVPLAWTNWNQHRTGREVRNVVIVTPGEGRPPSGVPDRRDGGAVHVEVWGREQCERLLRAVPSLLARYYPEEAQSAIRGYDGLPYSAFEASYRKGVVAANESMRTLGLPPEALRESDARNQIPLRQIFVPLNVVPEDDTSRKEPLAELLRRKGSAVLLGDPGTGKSTLLKFVALLHAGGATLDGFEPPKSILPIFVSLREYAQALRATADLSLLKYLEQHARSTLNVDRAHAAHFESALLLGEAFFLLDGLDEVGRDEARNRIAKQIRAFQAQYPAARIWLTCRVYGYTKSIALPKEHFVHVRVGRLEQAQIDDFVRRWHEIQEPTNTPERDRLTRSLQDAITRTPSVGRLATNPLLLTLMAFIHQGLRKLPQDRGELYEKCVEMLLKTWQEARRPDDQAGRDPRQSSTGEGAPSHEFDPLDLHPHVQKDYLAHLAIHIQEKNQGHKGVDARGLVDRKEATEVLAKRHLEVAGRVRPALDLRIARHDMSAFLDYVADQTGLLIDRGGGRLSFIHLSFQEYLAAWVFTCVGPADPDTFEARIGEPAWEEVLLLRLYVILNTPGGGGGRTFDLIASSLLRKLEEKDSRQAWLTLARALRDNLAFRVADKQLILEKTLAYWLQSPTFTGDWFGVLEEITLFAEKTRPELRTLLIEGVTRRHASESVACLHLCTRLLGFPQEVVTTLAAHSELNRMRPDLCAFFQAEAIAPLLATNTPDQWTAMLEGAESGDAYRHSVDWMSDPKVAPTALAGGTAFVWRKALVDLASRAAFAAKHRDRPDAGDLFEAGEEMRVAGWHYAVRVPFSGLRALIRSAGPAPSHASSLLHPGLATGSLRSSATDARAFNVSLEVWTAKVLTLALASLPAATPMDTSQTDSLAGYFVAHLGRTLEALLPLIRDHNFVRDFGRDRSIDLVRNHGRALGQALGAAFARGFCESAPQHALIHDFGYAFIEGVGRDIGRDFDGVFGRDFARELLQKFGVNPAALDADSQWRQAMASEVNISRAFGDWQFWSTAVRVLVPFVEIAGGANSTAAQIVATNPFSLPLALVDVRIALGAAWSACLHRHLAIQFPTGNVPTAAINNWLERNPFEAFSGGLAWAEHASTLHDRGISLHGPRGTLVLAHAAYCQLMSGLICDAPVWLDMLASRDKGDPNIEAAYLLHEICCFRDVETNVTAWKKLVQSPPDTLRPLFEAAGLISKTAPSPPKLAPTSPSPAAPRPVMAKEPLLAQKTLPWEHAATQQLHKLLSDAYSSVDGAGHLARTAGVRLETWDHSGGYGDAWRRLLDVAAAQGRLRRLLEMALADAGIGAYHAELRVLFNLQIEIKNNAPLLTPPPAAPGAAVTVPFTSTPPSASRSTSPPIVPPAPPERPAPREEVLFSWLHLSDIHIGHGGAAHGWDQEMVLDALARDVEKLHKDKLTPAPRAILVTGDVAFSGKPEQYDKARTWLERIAKALGLGLEQVFAVPGNHEVDREADKDRNTKRLLRDLRGGEEDLDDALGNDNDRALLTGRMAGYLAFAKNLGSPPDLHWSHAIRSHGVGIRLVGLNTGLLAMDDEDQGKLRLGKRQTALLREAREEELTIVLSHHPFADKWLADENDASGWTRQRADVHLCGHIHAADATRITSGSGTGIVTVVAGAAHGDRLPPGVPDSHGYNWAAVLRLDDETPVLRVWPRRWAPRTKEFRFDVDHLPDSKFFSEHTLARLRLPRRAT